MILGRHSKLQFTKLRSLHLIICRLQYLLLCRLLCLPICCRLSIRRGVRVIRIILTRQIGIGIKHGQIRRLIREGPPDQKRLYPAVHRQ